MSNYERNVQRILNPPSPTILDRIARLAWGLEELWCRHVAQRELYRQLDVLRLVAHSTLPPDRHTLERTKRDLQLIADAAAAEQEKPG
ncbi:hypothetical protein CIB93_08805 [Streptomyces sp. WZ.A104]|uniref:hypothetical protein n=1 Tax=Streptomyces sp. WZ.A104 TaxID=2023771 RepID=UPI000BBBB0BE|nr:hypothetical protein [Streptomyces sp. WZ.A104]PCG86330.1 hypothetical protein CIB93_08805 [Streptomyces sp. WZ.A104]